MPRGRSEKSILAEKRYHDGEKLVDIARSLGVPEGTVRRWKSDQDWDGRKRVSSQKKLTERSEMNPSGKVNAKPNVRKQSGANHTSKVTAQTPLESALEDGEQKTNSRSPNARPGNRNAVGNRGGPGGPVRNKHALKSGEYETIFFTADIMDEDERALLDVDYDKYMQQYLLIDTLTIREKRILQRIREAKDAAAKTGMLTESATVNKGKDKMSYTNRNAEGKETPGTDVDAKRDNSSVVSKAGVKRIMELEDALTRVQARKQAAITQLHRMEMDDDRLMLDHAKLELYKQRISGRIDLDDLISDDDLDIEL